MKVSSHRRKVLMGLIAFVLTVGAVYGSGTLFQGALKKPPSLTVVLLSSPTSQTVIRGENDVSAVGFSFTTRGTSAPVIISSITLSGYLDENIDGTFGLGTDNAVSIADVVTSLELYDGSGNLISPTPETFDATGKATFSGMSWTIPARSTETLVVVADVDSSSTPHNGTNDIFAIGITTPSTEIVAVDNRGNAITSITGSNINTGNPFVKVTVRESGVITVATSSDPVLDDKAIADNDSPEDPVLVARYKVYAQYEDFEVNSMTFTNDLVGDNFAEDNDLISSVILKYPTSASAPDTLDGEASAVLVAGDLNFTGLGMMVPASETDENAVEIEVYAVTNPIDSAGVVPSGAQIEMDFDSTSGFMASGVISFTTVTPSSTSDNFGNGGSTIYTSDNTNVDASQIAFYTALPTFEAHTSSVCPTSTLAPSIESSVYCFSVLATGSGQIQLYAMTFDAVPNLLNEGTSSGQLAATDSWKLYNYSSSGTLDSTAVGSGTWDSSTSQTTLTFDTSSTDSRVSAGSTKYYVLKAPVNFLSSTETSSLSVRIAAETAAYHVSNSAAASVAGLNVWSDSSASGHSVSTTDWTQSYKLDTLPTSYLILSES